MLVKIGKEIQDHKFSSLGLAELDFVFEGVSTLGTGIMSMD